MSIQDTSSTFEYYYSMSLWSDDEGGNIQGTEVKAVPSLLVFAVA